MSIATLDSYHTATTSSSSAISTAYATEGGSTIRSLHGNYVGPLFHRFTLIKPGAKQKRNSGSGSGSASPNSHSSNHKDGIGSSHSEGVGWNPFGNPFDFFASGFTLTKCDLCGKRLGWKPLLQCDDCGIKCVSFFRFLSLFLRV